MCLRLLILTIGLCAVRAMAQDCQSSADPNDLLNDISELAHAHEMPAGQFHSSLPCEPADVAIRPLLDALQSNLSLEQKKEVIERFHIKSPLSVADVDAISKSSISGQLINQLLSPLKDAHLTLEPNFRVEPDILALLKQKGVSDDVLSKLQRGSANLPPGTVPSPPQTDEAIPADPLSKLDAGPPKAGKNITQPEIVAKMEPEYSDPARAACLQGSDLLAVIIDDKGVPRDIKVVRPLGFGLDEKAVEAVSKWRFRPATKNGVPVTVRANIQVNFRLLGPCKPKS
jgi:TonB family protein